MITQRCGSFFFALLFAVVLLVPMPINAQVQVESDIETDSVDVFAVSAVPQKSVTLSMLADLAIPGLGHYYYGSKKTAFGFILADVLSIFGVTGCYSYANHLETSAHTFAMTYANVQGGSGATDYYWTLVGQYMDADYYNSIMELNRTPDDEILAENLQWRWPDDSYRQRFQDYRHSANNFRVAGNFFIGAMILNRVLAFVDMRAIGRNNGKGLFTNIHFYPNYESGTQSYGLTLQSSF